jgi:hypothetical protein
MNSRRLQLIENSFFERGGSIFLILPSSRILP